MYSYVKDNEKGGETANGIKKNIIKNNIKRGDYKNTLINNEQMHHKMKTIRSQRHLGTLKNITISTNPFIKHIGLHTSGQDIDSLYFFQNIGLHTSGQDIYPFYFPKYRPPYFWTRYDFLK